MARASAADRKALKLVRVYGTGLKQAQASYLLLPILLTNLQPVYHHSSYMPAYIYQKLLLFSFHIVCFLDKSHFGEIGVPPEDQG